MHLSAVTVLSLLTATVLSIPLPILSRSHSHPLTKRALTLQSYNDLSISAGVAGNAEAEALARFPIDPADLASVPAADIEILQTEREAAEAAEVDAFNPAIDAAASDEEKTALQNGKIKNKVLKLTAEVLVLQIQAAQGADKADKIAEEQKKLTKNISLDVAAAGQASTAVSFDG